MNHEDLEVYQKSVRLAVEILPYTTTLRPFRIAEQLASSCLSISSNIAEGFGYSSKKEIIRFLTYAKGSSAELSSQLYILKEMNPTDERIPKWRKESEIIQRMLTKLKASVANWR